MTGLELLEKYPLSAKVIKNWIMLQMMESFKDTSVPDEFKDFMLSQGVENDKVGTMIDAQPRMLFDVFDENNIIIETFLYPDTTFTIKIGNQATTNSWKTRRESEVFAIDTAFEILEDRLNEKRMNIIGQNGNTGEHYENE
jgi:hypothetical protein